MTHENLILGGPGCGKTTACLSIVEDRLSAGVDPSRIAYLAFTRKAAAEARERACDQFGFDDTSLPYFRTLHSLAFKELGLSREELMTEINYDELGQMLKVKFGPVNDETGIPDDMRERGSQWYYLEQQARLRMKDLRSVCVADGRQPYHAVQTYQNTLNNYKQHRGLHDFTDILEGYADAAHAPDLDLLIVDEAQDLSPLQWKLVKRLAAHAREVYYAGDDDQAIYRWAGADIDYFLKLDCPRRVLPVSHRLTRQCFDKCLRILKNIRNRYDKEWRSTERDGMVKVVGTPHMIDFSKGEFMVLARTHYYLESSKALMKQRGLPYYLGGKSSLDTPSATAAKAWANLDGRDIIPVIDLKRILPKFPSELLRVQRGLIANKKDDATVSREEALGFGFDFSRPWHTVLRMDEAEKTYLKAVERNGYALDMPPKIRLSTIHAVKGGECENVVLLPDMSQAAHDSFLRSRDDEARVFYVGASRAKQNLYITQPQTARFFPL